MSDLECLVRSAVVVLPDEIDVTNAGSVGEQLVAAIVPGVAVVVADLSITTFCDCAGVRSLLLAHREASASNAELRLVARSRAVLRILELFGTDQVLPVYPDLSAALAGGLICTGAEGAAPPSTWRTHYGRAPEMPPNRHQTANDRHQQQPANMKLVQALNPASNARDTLVVLSSAAPLPVLGPGGPAVRVSLPPDDLG